VDGFVQDGAGNAGPLAQQTVVLDQTKPTAPANVTRTVSCTGNTNSGTRTVTLFWSPSTDANFVGYRIYRSTDGTTWQQIAITTLLDYADTMNRTNGNTSLRYYVVGYDKAGNESSPSTPAISLANNDCS
jgi:hypothetical protein